MDDLEDNIAYIDPLGFKSKIKIANNNIIVGRRGSGKTTIMLSTYKEKSNCNIIKYDCQHIRNYSENQIIIKLVNQVISEINTSSQVYMNELNKKIKESQGHFWEKPKDELQVLSDEVEELKNICNLTENMYTLLVDIYELPEEITYKRSTKQVNKQILKNPNQVLISNLVLVVPLDLMHLTIMLD